MTSIESRKLIIFIMGMIFCTSAFSQNIIPNGFAFQSIARDINGNIAPNRTIYLQVEIIRDTINPVSVYKEIQQTTTTLEGIFNITIGNGTQLGAPFSQIKWIDAPYSLKIKIAVTPSNPSSTWNYEDALVDAGTVPLLSVPYAKVAGNGLDSTKVFFLRDTSSILAKYLRIDSLASHLSNKINISDSIFSYVTPSQLKSGGIDTAQMLSGYLRKNNALTSISIDTINGILGTIKNPFSSPILSFRLGNISPSRINSPFGQFDTLSGKYLILDKISGTIINPIQPYISSLGQLANLSVAGTIDGGTFNGVLSNTAQNSITGLGNLQSLTVTNTIATTNLFVTGTITGGIINGTNIGGTLTSPSQPNISSLGQLTNLSVAGAIDARTLNGVLSNAAQNSITSLGNLQNLTVTNTIAASNLNVAGTINSGTINGATINGTNIGGTLTNPSQPNISSLGQLTNLSVAGTIDGGSFNGVLGNKALNSITSLGSLQNLTVTNTITASNLGVMGTITAGTISGTNITGTLTTPSQPNISSLGQLTNLSVAGTIDGGTFNGVLGNSAQNSITVLGNLQNLTVTNTIASSNLAVAGTITGGTISGANITGTSINGILASPSQPYISSLGQLTNLSVIGTIDGGTFNGVLSNAAQNSITGLGTLQNLTVTNTISGVTINGTNIGGTLTSPSQPNISSLGQLANLSVAGTIDGGTFNGVLSNAAQNSITSLGTLQNLTVTNAISGVTINGTNIGGTLTSPSQPNISAIGELTNLSVTGTIASNTISTGTVKVTTINGLNLPQGNVTDSIVTVSGGVLRKIIYVSQIDTFTNDFVVNGVNNYLKWTNGDTVPAKGKTAVQLLQEGATQSVNPTYNSPTVSLSSSPTGGNFEIGSTLNVTLNSSFTQNDAGALINTLYKKNGSNLAGNTDNINNFTSAVQYSVSITYGQGACKNDNLGQQNCTGRIVAGNLTSSSITFTPLPGRYWGYASSATPSDVDLKNAVGGGTELSNSKAKSSFSISIPGVSSYLFFAYPASLGSLSSISVGGFESIGTFTLITRILVNASGYSQSYNIYVSNNNFSTSVS